MRGPFELWSGHLCMQDRAGHPVTPCAPPPPHPSPPQPISVSPLRFPTPFSTSCRHSPQTSKEIALGERQSPKKQVHSTPSPARAPGVTMGVGSGWGHPLAGRELCLGRVEEILHPHPHPLFAGHLLHAGTLESLRMWCEPGADPDLGGGPSQEPTLLWGVPATIWGR